MEKELEYDDNKPGEQVDGEDFRTKYRFNDELDEKGNRKHEHLLWSERKNEYEQLTGVTTVLDVLGKVLTWWASGLAVSKLGWTNSKIKVDGKYQTTLTEQRLAHLKPIREAQSKLDDKDYLSLLDEAYKAHSVRLDETADVGTDLHAELEKYVKWHMAFNSGKGIETFESQKWSDKTIAFAQWADKNVKRFLWSEGYCYDEILFMGGITDCGVEMKDGTFGIIDFKSAKEAYFNHFVQIAIYDLLMNKNGLFNKDGTEYDIDGMEDFTRFTKYFVIPFGAKEFKVEENNKIKGLKDAGIACITLYRQKSIFENK